MVTLVQSAAASPNSGSIRILVAVGLLIVVVLVFGLFALRLRKRLLADDAQASGPPLLLDDLRKMLARGEITQSEYDTMRARIREKLAAQSQPPLSPPRAADTKSITPSRTASNDRTAPPGFDLTGERLPGPQPGE